jgi:hypothetical protein
MKFGGRLRDSLLQEPEARVLTLRVSDLSDAGVVGACPRRTKVAPLGQGQPGLDLSQG